jgi:hypothetical protein
MTPRRFALAAGLVLSAVTACSTTTTAAPPTTTGTSVPAGSCQVNPANAPVPTATAFQSVPKADTISVATSGIPSDTVTPGSAPTEVDVTLCNDSPVSYPAVGVVIVLDHCSCAPNPNSIAKGTVERFDAATGDWTELDHASAGTGMDYLGTSTNVQPLPKGKTVTLRYRIALDASMTAGKGGVSATAVIPDGPYQIGGAGEQFTVAAPGPAPAAGQTELPFTGLDNPGSVAVDAAGDVFVTDGGNNRVLKLAAGSTNQTVLPFTGLDYPVGVAVDAGGAVYVVDSGNNRVLKLAAGSTNQTALPFTGLDHPADVAVDSAGTVYVAGNGSGQVTMLATGASTSVVLPVTRLQEPIGVATDTAGAVYVLDAGTVGASAVPAYRVVKMAAGSNAQTDFPLADFTDAWAVTVDGAGNVYVANQDRVVKFAAGSDAKTDLPFTGLKSPAGVEVDAAGAVYVVDRGNDRVVKLAAG